MKRTTLSNAHSSPMTTLSRSVGIILCALLLVGSASAQDVKGTQGSTPSGLAPGGAAGAYALSDFDTVNVYNGNLNLHLPLVSIGGRGGAAMTVMLARDSLKWGVVNRVSECPENEPSCCPEFNTPKMMSGGSVPDFKRAEDNFVDNKLRAGFPGYGPGALVLDTTGVGSHKVAGTTYYGTSLTRLKFISSEGTEYELRDRVSNGEPRNVSTQGTQGFNRGSIFVSVDGTSATFISTDAMGSYEVDVRDQIVIGIAPTPVHGYLILRDGTRYWIQSTGGTNSVPQVKWMRDRNGNLLSFEYGTDVANPYAFKKVTRIMDSLNRVVQITYSLTEDSITYSGFGGALRTIRILRTRLSDSALRSDYLTTDEHRGTRTYAQLFPELSAQFDTNPNSQLPRPNDYFDPYVLTAVILPDGRSYQLRYNRYGELARVEVPTGGTVEYDYTAGSGVIEGNIYRKVKQRRVLPGGTGPVEQTTTYGDPVVTGAFTDAATTIVTVTNQTSVEKHYYYGDPYYYHDEDRKWDSYTKWTDAREYRTEIYKADGVTLLRKVEHTWENRAPVEWWTLPRDGQPPQPRGNEPPNDPRIIKTVTTLTDVSPYQKAQQTFEYDDYNNRTDMYEYDYGSGAVGAKLRHTRTQYLRQLTSNGADYAAGDHLDDIHLRSLPRAQQVFQYVDGVEVEQSRTTYEYDKYSGDGNHAALLARAGITGHDDAFGISKQARGNVTATFRWLKDEVREVTTYQQYDVAGNVVRALEARGAAASNKYWTSIDYADNFGRPDGDAGAEAGGSRNTYALATLVTNALGQSARTQYDYWTGKAVDVKDANAVVTSMYYGGALDRPIKVIRDAGNVAAKSQTTFTYMDAEHMVRTTSDLNTFGDGKLKSEVVYDGLGRTLETRSYETASTYISVKQRYDVMGRVSQQSNPSRSGAMIWTVTRYDELGRVTEVQSAGSDPLVTTYLGNTVTVRDQTGRGRQSATDALGRLTAVVEDPGGLNYATAYRYDALDNLVKVEQGNAGQQMQQRNFVYDTLSRLKSATNPESGLISYKYDDNGNLVEKTDERKLSSTSPTKVKTTYTYDKLNRVKTRTYNDGTPPVAYYYDDEALPLAGFDRGTSKGRLVAVTSGSTGEGSYYGYDALGRVVRSAQRTGILYSIEYKYDLAGHLTSERYPTGRIVKSEYDATGRLSCLRGERAGETQKTYAESFLYTAHGAVSKVRLGNGLWEHTLYNTRLQPTEIGLGVSATNSAQLKLTYSYGEIINGALDRAQNNGNVQSQRINLPGLTLAQTYTYDRLNRLQAAEEKKGTLLSWKQVYEYDRFGNRRIREGAGQTTINAMPEANPVISEVNNRITSVGYQYDAAGNMRNAPGHSYTFDAENRLVMFDAGTEHAASYCYDGEGRRVKKVVGIGTAAITTTFVYDAMGKPVSEYETKTAGSETGVRYYTQDTLGSTRVVTSVDNANKAVVKARSDYLPFGEEIAVGVGGRAQAQGYLYGSAVVDKTRRKFTSYERDAESGLDYAQARYYSNMQGRFISADSVAGSSINPQTLNLYAYTGNNPLNNVDPSGHMFYSAQFNGGGSGFGSPDSAGELPERDQQEIARIKEASKRQQQLRPPPALSQQQADEMLAAGARYGPITPLAPIPQEQVDVIRSGIKTTQTQTCIGFISGLLTELGSRTGVAPFSTDALKIFDEVRNQGGFNRQKQSSMAITGGTIGQGNAQINYGLSTDPLTNLHELVHVAPNSGVRQYTHEQMAQAAYDVAINMGLKVPYARSKRGQPDGMSSIDFTRILFIACHR
ncbi:MAG: RHS repeat-associated core domain-containing protein [Pyrinomonadaceae bacterium]